MGEVTKPESYAKLEKEKGDLALFRQSPYKDWAPLPTPMITFASSVLDGEDGGKGERRKKGGGKGKGEDSGQEQAEDGGKGRKGGSAWSKGGAPEKKEGDQQEAEWEGGENGEGWGEWDESYWANQSWNARPPRGRSQRASSWYGAGPQWVEKGTAKTDEEWNAWEGEEGTWPSASKSGTWASKVKSEARGQPASRWQAKVTKNEGDAAAPEPTPAEAAGGGGDATNGSGAAAADEQPGASKGPSWADRARAAAK